MPCLRNTTRGCRGAAAFTKHDSTRDYDCILGDRIKISGTYREFIVSGALLQ